MKPRVETQNLNSDSQLSVVSCQLQKQKATGDGRRTTDQSGFTLLELIVTLTVLAVMVLATVPLAQNAHKRQKEQQLRESLREIRQAIDEFKRDTYGACPQGNNPVPPDSRSSGVGGAGGGRGGGGLGGGNNVPTDPRSRVVIDDCTIFDTENLDRYPPTLEILVDGVKVKARGMNINTGGGVFNDDKDSVVFNDEPKEVKKVYLREIPIDPMTGEADWILRSSYQEKGSDSWDDINVFDVRSRSDEEALNGEKYSDW